MTASYKEHADKIGTTIKHRVGELIIDVRILDIKQAWGQVKYQITPVKGSGAVWIVVPGVNGCK